MKCANMYFSISIFNWKLDGTFGHWKCHSIFILKLERKRTFLRISVFTSKLKIEKWFFFFNFQLTILLKNWKFKIHFSCINCRIYLRNCTSREIVIGFVLISLAEAMWCLKEKEKIILQLTLKRERDLEEVMRSNVASNTPYYACI